MFLPDIPIWCWNVLGEDHVRLSQPTHYYAGGTPYFLPVKGPCAARCQYEFWIEDAHRPVRSHPIACGRLAMLLEDRSYRCWLHSGADLVCAWCEEYAARGDTRSCPGCHATWKQQGMPDWCCPDASERTDLEDR